MIEINGREYSEEYLEKAIIFYESLKDGSIAEAIKRGLRE